MSTKKQRVMVIPAPAQGHVKPLMVFSHKLAKHGFRITFVNTEFNHKRVLSAINEESGTSFGSQIELVSIPDGLSPEDDGSDIGQLCKTTQDIMPLELEKLIRGINGSQENDKISCVVSDFHISWTLEVAAKMGVKGALFSPSSAALIVYTMNMPQMIHDGIMDSEGFSTKNQIIRLSTGMPAMETSKLPWNIGDLVSQKIVFHQFLKSCQASKMADWWLCNSAYDYEASAFSLLPKLLPIGPLIENQTNSSVDVSGSQFWAEDTSCLTWLDQHKPRSVIYVAFGSLMVHDQAQFQELALGLKLTGRPFLWVVRPGFISNEQNSVFNLDGILGHDNNNLGKIVSWAPQQKILGHPSIACFVTHCGWNSTMEGLSNGVPLLCWPFLPDQILDKGYICDVWKVGMGFEYNENGIISREEIKNKIDKLLNDKNIRKMSLDLKELGMKNIAKDGQSSKNFNNFIKWLEEA